MIKEVPRPVVALSVLQLDYEATQQTGADSSCPTCGKENLAPKATLW
ncbi:flagellar basal body-associated protein [Vibrio splendidus 12B01]|nr:flagellar basal body-associated protein [Vibrio splendidus 12B01]